MPPDELWPQNSNQPLLPVEVVIDFQEIIAIYHLGGIDITWLVRFRIRPVLMLVLSEVEHLRSVTCQLIMIGL
jgi:hypothetical protein